MFKAFIFSVILLFSVIETMAQTPADSVKSVIAGFFTAMKNGDSKTILYSFTDSAIMQTIARDKEGGTVVKTEKIVDFVSIVGSMPVNAADERITFDVVKVDGPLAIVWTPYKFYLNGQFSHCGVNSFQLIRQTGRWKIQYIIDTRRKQGCE